MSRCAERSAARNSAPPGGLGRLLFRFFHQRDLRSPDQGPYTPHTATAATDAISSRPSMTCLHRARRVAGGTHRSWDRFGRAQLAPGQAPYILPRDRVKRTHAAPRPMKRRRALPPPTPARGTAAAAAGAPSDRGEAAPAGSPSSRGQAQLHGCNCSQKLRSSSEPVSMASRCATSARVQHATAGIGITSLKRSTSPSRA